MMKKRMKMPIILLLIFTITMVGPINSAGLGNWFATGVSAGTGLSLIVDKPKQTENRQFNLTLKDDTALSYSDDPPSDKGPVNVVTVAIPVGMTLDLEATKEHNAAKNMGTIDFDEESRSAQVTWNSDATEHVYDLLLTAEKAQSYMLQAVRYDASGNAVESNLIAITVESERMEEVMPEIDEEETVTPRNPQVMTRVADEMVTLADVVDPSVANVSTLTEFHNAMMNKDIATINVLADINYAAFSAADASPTNTGASYQRMPERPFTINGNGHTIDFRNQSYAPTDTYSLPKVVTFNDLNTYGKNYYGFYTDNSAGGTNATNTIVYNNVNYRGSQAIHAPATTTKISGKSSFAQTNSYVSPFDGVSYTTLANQTTFAVGDMNILEGADVKVTNESSGAMYIFSGGTVDIAENSVLDIYTSGTNATVADGAVSGITSYGNIYVRNGATLKMDNAVPSSGTAVGGIWMNAGTFSVSNNAKVDIKARGAMYYGSPFYISGAGTLNVSDDAEFKLEAMNTGTSTQDIFSTGTGTILIGRNGVFDVSSDGTGAKYLVYLRGTSKFQFANAKRVDIKFNNTNPAATARLLRMSGNLDVDVQSIQAWNAKTWTDGMDDNSNFIWNPMFGVKVTYSAANVTAATGQSVNAAIKNSFTTNFRTQNFKRVLFEGIPDVDVTIGNLSDNVNRENSRVITGKANPGASVKLSGDPAIPVGTLDSPNEEDKTTKFHLIADNDGNYRYELPEGKVLTAGSTVTVYAFLNGKDNSAQTIVQDDTVPDAPVLTAIKDVDAVISGQAEAGSTVTIYDLADDSEFVSGVTNGAGNFAIAVPVEKRPMTPNKVYYAVAKDAAGNVSTKSNQMSVVDTTAPTADVIRQFVTLGDTFTTNPKNLVENVTDNAGDGDDNISYAITKVPDVSKIGYSTATVTLTDNAGNAANFVVPVFVQDSSSIKDENYLLHAEDFAVATADLPTTPAAMKDMVLEMANVQAYVIATGASAITSVQMTGVETITTTPGKYQVKVTLGELEREITVTVLAGTLQFKSATPEISFGTAAISSREQFLKPQDDVKLTVEDTRSEGTNWKLTAQLDAPLATADGEELINSLFVRSQEDGNTILIPLNGVANEIFSNTSSSDGVTEIDLNTADASELVLNIRPGTARANKEYSTTIHWTLEDTP
ncbi:pectate lyase-like adhesive domain-containing protein [Listeria rocourtiae]|uniref:pectate lyase-like adhesive domain-containing protein n=1 Tax=Listeria rocourtiae TaxID=647910 RepID=UPI003D2F6FCB